MEKSKWSKLQARLGTADSERNDKNQLPKHQVSRSVPRGGSKDQRRILDQPDYDRSRPRTKRSRTGDNGPKQVYHNSTFLDEKGEESSVQFKALSEADDDFVIVESFSENGNYPRNRKMSSGEQAVDKRNPGSSSRHISSAESGERNTQTTSGKANKSKSETGDKRNNSDDKANSATKHRRNNEHIKPSKSSDNIQRKSAQSTNPNTLRNVVYYQNRFIVLDSNHDKKSPSNSSRKTVEEPRKKMAEAQSGSYSGEDELETTFSKGSTANNRSRTKHMEMDASSVTMDARGIEIIVTDPDDSSRKITDGDYKKKTWYKKFHRMILDNRMKGKPPLEQPGEEEYRILKKVLNITFLTVGIVLFVSVVVVVIYALVVGDQIDKEAEELEASTNSNT